MGQLVASTNDLTAYCTAFGCGEALARTIAGLARQTAHARGVRLWPVEGREDTTLMLRGSAQEVAYGREGAMLVMLQLAQGDFYGSLAGSDGGDSLVEAITAGAGAHFESAVMLRLMESYPCVGLAIARHLSHRLAAMRQRMVEATLLSVTGRIAAELLRRSAANESRIIQPMPVFSELAVAINSTRETVSRTVSQFEKRGLIVRVEGGLKIVAVHRLQDLVY